MPDQPLHARLLGRWELVAFVEVDAAGVAEHVLGPDAAGYIAYDADGWVSVQIMGADRPTYDGTSVDSGSAEQSSAAAKSYLAYAGTYAVDGDMVIHHVAFSLQPNWVGHALPRHIAFEGADGLVLTSPISPTSGRTTIVRWRRVAGR